jgi:hypothetical protein
LEVIIADQVNAVLKEDERIPIPMKKWGEKWIE